MIPVRCDRSPAPAPVSVIVPVLNEAARIGGLLEELTLWSECGEIIVVDGGSADATRSVVSRFQEVLLLCAPRGRGPQMNAGAEVATGEVYLFLHADVRLPLDAMDHIAASLADPRVVAGAFRTLTILDDGPPWLGPLLGLADLRSRFTSLPYGDQALFVRAGAFRLVGGFPEIPILEDLELSRRLRRIGRIQRVEARVTVSGRRFAARPIYYAALMNVLPWLFRLGVPAKRLASLYGDPR